MHVRVKLLSILRLEVGRIPPKMKSPCAQNLMIGGSSLILPPTTAGGQVGRSGSLPHPQPQASSPLFASAPLPPSPAAPPLPHGKWGKNPRLGLE